MPFPQCERVIYSRNPLVEVTCQLDFEPSDGEENPQIRADQAIEIHSGVKNELPQFSIGKKLTVDLNTESKQVISNEEPTYEFISVAQDVKITLTRDFVNLTVSNYSGWEDFSSLLSSFLEQGLYQVIERRGYRRVGLRYKDIIQRSSLGLEGHSWNELLNSYISKLYDEENCISKNIIGEQSSIRVKLEDNGQLSLQYGLVTNNATREECFLIDGDFFHEGKVNNGSVREYMDKYNLSARNLFRWCITDKVHNALQPQKA